MTDLLVRVLVCGLCGWRLASLLVTEDGPFDVFRRIRLRFGLDEDTMLIDGFWMKLLSCVWCCSVWTTALAWLWWEVHPGIPGVFAAMSIALAAERFNRA